MTEQKRNPNPFIRAAQEAKAAKENHAPTTGNKPVTKTVSAKPQTGFGGRVVRKTGRGG